MAREVTSTGRDGATMARRDQVVSVQHKRGAILPGKGTSMSISDLRAYSDTQLEEKFAWLHGSYADHYHPLSDEIIAQFESVTYPLPTETDEKNGWQIVSLKGIQSILVEFWEQKSIVPDYLLLNGDDLRALLFAISSRNRCWTSIGGEFAGSILLSGYNHRYWAETHMKMMQYIRDERLSQGTMMFLYQPGTGDHQ